MDTQDTIDRMTLEQKCALLSGATEFTTRGFPALGVPELRFSDGPSGLRKQAGAADHLGLNPSEPATCFPSASTIACSWDVGLAEREGAAMGVEAAAQGVNVLLGPGLNIKRNPLCGRNFEYYSEDPLLAGELAAGFVRGVQSAGVSACPKHFAVNTQETRRMTSDSVIDERTMRELYLTGFERVVREGRPRTVMTSYNLVNGVYANESPHLLQDILRDEWGFDGAVVTDWGGSNDHVAGVAAGSTFEMPNPGASSVWELVEAVRSGRLDEVVLDERVAEALDLVLATDAAVKASPSSFDAAAHHQLARRIAAQCAVLLKNEGALLPLAPGTRVAVIGDFAKTPRYQGAGSSAVNPTQVDALLGALAEKDLELVGFERGFLRDGARDQVLVADAARLARKADVALVCLGLTEAQESEGVDRRDMRLNDNQLELLDAVAAANRNVVVLLFTGSAVEVPWLERARAALLVGLGGQAGAGAVLDVVCGDVCPSGRLAETWPVRYEDVPSAATYPAEGRVSAYRESVYVGYRYFDTAGEKVALPFGFGLSYTSFSYDALEPCDPDERGVPTAARVRVTNTGDVAGAEVVQLYAARRARRVFGPLQQLAGFAKVWLEPGESRVVDVEVSPRAFEHWNVATGAWEIEGGTFELRASASSRDVRLVRELTLEGTGAPDPYEGLDLALYETGAVREADDAVFERLLGRRVPSGRPAIDRTLTMGELGHGRSPIGWAAGAVVRGLYRRSLASNAPDLNIAFVYGMPLRAVAKMTGGRASMGMVDAIVCELRGFWVVGIVRLLVEAVRNGRDGRRLERALAAAEKDGGAR